MTVSPRSTVVVLSQPHEASVLELTLHHLLRGSSSDVAVLVLINGGSGGVIRAAHGHDPRIRVIDSARNLGVAGGRRVLLTHPLARAAEVNVILDNDVITPPRLIEALSERLSADADIGVLGPATLNLPRYRDGIPDLSVPIESEAMMSLYAGAESSSFFHLGTNPDWYAAYIEERDLGAQLLDQAGLEASFHTMLREDPQVMRRIRTGDLAEIPATNVAGACQAIRREIVDEVGLPDPIFSPYGYEDVDFCIRVRLSGRRVAVHPDLVILHGTDERHAERQEWEQRRRMTRNLHRCRTLLAYSHGGSDWLAHAHDGVLRRFVVQEQQLGVERARVLLDEGVKGIRHAIRQLRTRHGAHLLTADKT